GNGQGRERAEPCAPEARDGGRRACREILARQACRAHAGSRGELRKRERRGAVDVPGDERVRRHGQEGRARHAETPRNPVREKVLQVLESTRRRQLADEREQALAIPPGLAILKARESGGQAPTHGPETERPEKSGGGRQRGPPVRNAPGEGLREEELGKREEAGSDEKSAEQGRGLPAE